MKKRQSILQYKLQHIETQYPYMFVFHCSGLTNSQWRQFKQLLSKSKANTLFQPSRCGKPSALSNEMVRERCASTFSGLQPEKLTSYEPTPLSMGSLKQNKQTSGSLRNRSLPQASAYRPLRFKAVLSAGQKGALQTNKHSSLETASHLVYTTGHIKQSIVVGGSNFAKGTNTRNRLLSRGADSGFAPQFKSKLPSLPGPLCIVYSTQTGPVTPNTSLAPWIEFLKQIDSAEHKAHLVLLYGHFNSTRINHIDIKQARNLETKSVLQHFLGSMLYPAQHFESCLNQGSSDLIQYVTQSTSLKC
jgi:hypothetical protein